MLRIRIAPFSLQKGTGKQPKNILLTLLMGKNSAPLRMPQMLVLYQYQEHLGHPKWCRMFLKQPYYENIILPYLLDGTHLTNA